MLNRIISQSAKRLRFNSFIGPFFSSSSSVSQPTTEYTIPHVFDTEPGIAVVTGTDTYTATVALVGAPNAGKSSLSNALVGQRVSAVSRKLNTTRTQTVAAYTNAERQIVLYDTPGLVERSLTNVLASERRSLATEAWGAATDADVAAFVVDVSRDQRYWKYYAKVAGQLADIRQNKAEISSGTVNDSAVEDAGVGTGGHCLLILNKIDCARPFIRVFAAAQFFRDHIPNFTVRFHPHIFMTSAFEQTGVQQLRDHLLSLTTPGEFETEPGTAHLDSDLDLIREHIWEKLLHRVHKEVPYRCFFENDSYKTLPNGDIYVSEIIRAPSRTTASMIIGARGDVLRWIRESAMQSTSEVLKCRVFIKLTVAVAKKRKSMRGHEY